MLNRFWNKYKIEILEGYVVAAVGFTCLSGLGLSWMGTAIAIAFANTYLVNPLVKALKFGNVTNEDIMQVNHKRFIINIIKALLITGILVSFYYQINKYLFPTSVEPITFGVLFKIMDIYLIKLRNYFRLKTKTC